MGRRRLARRGSRSLRPLRAVRWPRRATSASPARASCTRRWGSTRTARPWPSSRWWGRTSSPPRPTLRSISRRAQARSTSPQQAPDRMTASPATAGSASRAGATTPRWSPTRTATCGWRPSSSPTRRARCWRTGARSSPASRPEGCPPTRARLGAGARKNGQLFFALADQGAVLQAIVEQVQLHRTALGVGPVQEREREARALEIGHLLVQPRQGALAGAANATQVLQLAVEGVGGAQVALPRGVV